MFAHRITWSVALAACLAVLAFGALRAQDAPAEKPKLKLNRDAAAKAAAQVQAKQAAAEKNEKDAKQDDADAKSKDDADEKDADEKDTKSKRFAVPEGGVPDLLNFIQATLKFQPTSREEFLEYREKGFPAMKEAAEKAQEIATDEDKKLPGYGEVDGLLLYFRSQEARTATPEEREELIADLKKYFSATPEPSRYGIAAAQQLATTLEYSENPQEAIPVYQELGAALASSNDPTTAKTGLKMEGAARRLDLVGKPLEISGTEIDGEKFDWANLRGKVVLVDFWATWCGPCRAEVPNVKKNYELYHDKGFEVVGINLDDNREALDKYLTEEQPAWTTLHDGGWSDNEVATHYGIMGIPTVILVDQEGKVVSTRARGPELGKLLGELLGPADEGDDAEEKTSDKSDEKSEAKSDKDAADQSE